MKVLVFSPHADDGILAMGGTIARLMNEGNDIYYCIATKAYNPVWSEECICEKSEEINKVSESLNIKMIQLDFKAACLDEVPIRYLNAALGKVIENIQPDIAFIPNLGDLHFDHRKVHESALVELRPLKKHVTIYTYETLSETEWGTSLFEPNVYFDITNTLGNKVKAMRIYKTELRELPHPRSEGAIKALSQKRGSEICVPYAEAFHLVRQVL